MIITCKNKLFNKFFVVAIFMFVGSVFCKTLFTESKATTGSSKNDCVTKVKRQQQKIISHLNRIEYKMDSSGRIK